MRQYVAKLAKAAVGKSWPFYYSSFVIVLVAAYAMPTFSQPPTKPALSTSQVSSEAMAEYNRKLAEYTSARQKYHDDAATYWALIGQKRATRNDKRRAHQAIVFED